LRWLPVHLAGIMLYFIPLVALFLSWLFLDEQFTFLQGVGFIVTVQIRTDNTNINTDSSEKIIDALPAEIK
jgi:threonine/homoserine efflux transporter RhtA